MNPGGRDCSEPRLCHCTPEWMTVQDSVSILKKSSSDSVTTTKNPQNHPVLKGARDLNKHFSKGTQMDNRYIKYSVTLIFKELHNRTEVRYPLIPVKMASVKKIGSNGGW